MQTTALSTSEASKSGSATSGGGVSSTNKSSKSSFKTSMKENLNLKGGELKCSVLSVYDLPTREQPSFVSVTACGATVTTGGPTSRHKDRNSFKFGGSSNSSAAETLILKAQKLEHLYGALLKVQVVYEDKPWLNLSATYTMKQLHVHEATWLVLNLESPPGSATAAQQDTITTTSANNNNNYMEDVPPTIRLKVQLRGPYRPEVAALLTLSSTWFAFMDNVESSCQQLASSIKVPLPGNKGLLLIPAVPLLTGAVVIAPIVAGLCVLFLPVFVPVVAAIFTILTCVVGTGLVLYSSTSTGRQWWWGHMLEPAGKTLLNTSSGQSLVYETGPRPTPVSVARIVLPSQQSMWGRLMLSLAIDLIGNLSYIVPIVGEVADIAWAPLQTTLIMAMYDTTTPHLKYVSFVEEILPFTDFIPSATIGWAAQFGPKLIKGGISSSSNDDSTTMSPIPSSLTVPVPNGKKE